MFTPEANPILYVNSILMKIDKQNIKDVLMKYSS